MNQCMEALKSVCAKIEEPMLLSIAKEIFYREDREQYIIKLQEEIDKQRWTEAEKTIGDILSKKEICEEYVECKRLDSLKLKNWTTDKYIELYLELLSLNFSEKRLNNLKDEIKKRGGRD